MNSIRHIATASWEWFVERAESPYAKLWLVVLSVSESAFFLIPPDPLLMALVTARRERAVEYTLVTTLASVLGGLLGYVIGVVAFETFAAKLFALYGLEESVREVKDLFITYSFWTIFVAAFTPIPYKVFTILAGLFRINISLFIIASLLGRGLRYGLVSFFTYYFGATVVRVSLRYANHITVALVLAATIYFMLKFV